MSSTRSASERVTGADSPAKLSPRFVTEPHVSCATESASYDASTRLTVVSRVCSATKDAVVPLSKPIYCTDGTRMDEIAVPKGTQVMVGMLGCNTSKALWGEDACEWKPERWLNPLPAQVTAAHIPGVYSNL